MFFVSKTKKPQVYNHNTQAPPRVKNYIYIGIKNANSKICLSSAKKSYFLARCNELYINVYIARRGQAVFASFMMNPELILYFT